MQDSHRVWLTIGSTELSSGAAIGQLIGLEPNNQPRRPNAPPRKVFNLESDLEISEHAPMEDHLRWLVDRTRERSEVIRRTCSRPEFWANILIQIVTDQFRGDFNVPHSLLLKIAELGVDIHFSVISEAGDVDDEEIIL
ncbi:DUF4279 domain-containing protein [Acuticoccus sp. M5D2P5]|uniref:DUF4279 domain-containing protein n=1 Tax=Acuticoccus kalidii TaxID=2910977 RepID=UPI001F3CE76E|nr:DUF4279 domain-containing protein [Acuticoccus kalidii]MCF3933378.1 DUF4279 domain-containing protein [Acuticoccus kalidii]